MSASYGMNWRDCYKLSLSSANSSDGTAVSTINRKIGLREPELRMYSMVVKS